DLEFLLDAEGENVVVHRSWQRCAYLCKTSWDLALSRRRTMTSLKRLCSSWLKVRSSSRCCRRSRPEKQIAVQRSVARASKDQRYGGASAGHTDGCPAQS